MTIELIVISVGAFLGVLSLLSVVFAKQSQTSTKEIFQQVTHLTNELERTKSALLHEQKSEMLQFSANFSEKIQAQKADITTGIQQLKETINQNMHEHKEQFDKRHIESLKNLNDTLSTNIHYLKTQLSTTLKETSQLVSERLEKLNNTTETRLKDIGTQVDKRLSEGFEKTTATFTDIIKRLAIIDEAQKKITELSGNVVSLQEILTDKRSRGAFGEVQLAALIRNMLPEQHFKLQHTLSNDKRADCMLFLPKPTGNIVIDSKFPLESFRALQTESMEQLGKQAETTFKNDIRKHIDDIAAKYIIKNETADGAIMFIPAEAVFAEIHSKHTELVDYAHKKRVWLVSPTTMMAILTTARAVIKDDATKKQVHIIQEHLHFLSQDFSRFQKRMDNLSRHIQQVHTDIEQAHTSAKKISSRFTKIEKVEIEHLPENSIAEVIES